jgi:hypothetical protein
MSDKVPYSTGSGPRKIDYFFICVLGRNWKTSSNNSRIRIHIDTVQYEQRFNHLKTNARMSVEKSSLLPKIYPDVNHSCSLLLALSLCRIFNLLPTEWRLLNRVSTECIPRLLCSLSFIPLCRSHRSLPTASHLLPTEWRLRNRLST